MKHRQSKKINLPKWTSQRTLEEISVDFVREVFRGWRVASQQATDVGIDLRFEIVDSDGSTTGAEVSCQVKATKKLHVSGDAVTQRLKLSTANYFLVRPELVLLIIYDARKRQAYWSWVQDYLRQNWSGAWEQQKTLTIKLPTGNLLNAESRSIIEKRVRWHHDQQRTLTAARTINDPHYEYQVTISDHEITVGVLPKYPGAEQDKPLKLTGQFRFDLKTPEGAEAFAKLDRMVKAGEDLELDGRFIERVNLPDTLAKIFVPTNDFQPSSIAITSTTNKEVRPAKLTFVSSDGRFRSEFPYVEYKVVRAGTEEALLSNEGQPISTTFEVLARRDGKVKFNLSTHGMGHSAKEVLNILHLQAVFATGGVLLTEFLKTGQRSKGPIPPSSMLMPEDWLIGMAEDLSFIESVFQVSVIWPKTIQINDIVRIRPIAQILRTGIATGFVDQHIALRISGERFRWLTENYVPGDVGTYRTIIPAYHVSMFGVEVDLGPVEITIPTARFTEESEVLISSKRQVTADEFVILQLKQGVEPARYRFIKWLPIDTEPSSVET